MSTSKWKRRTARLRRKLRSELVGGTADDRSKIYQDLSEGQLIELVNDFVGVANEVVAELESRRTPTKETAE